MATVFADGIKLEAGKVTAGTNGTGTPVLGTASTATIDFDGRTGGDVLGGTVKIGNTTYSFVEDATKAKEGTTAIVVAKDAKSADIAKAYLVQSMPEAILQLEWMVLRLSLRKQPRMLQAILHFPVKQSISNSKELVCAYRLVTPMTISRRFV